MKTNRLTKAERMALARVEKLKIDYCCSVFGISYLDVLRWGLDDLFESAISIQENYPELMQKPAEKNAI